MWLEPYKIEFKKLTIAEMAELTTPEEVMTRSGWLVEVEPNLFQWRKTQKSGNSVSCCQLALHFGIHAEWLKYQWYITKADEDKYFELLSKGNL